VTGVQTCALPILVQPLTALFVSMAIVALGTAQLVAA